MTHGFITYCLRIRYIRTTHDVIHSLERAYLYPPMKSIFSHLKLWIASQLQVRENSNVDMKDSAGYTDLFVIIIIIFNKEKITTRNSFLSMHKACAM